MRVGTSRRMSAKELILLNCGVGEDSWEPHWTARRSYESILKEIIPEYSLEGLMSTEAPILGPPDVNKELTHWKRPWCWERLKAEGEEDDKGQDGWMVSSTQRTRVWPNSGRQWRTGKSGVLQSMGSQRTWTTKGILRRGSQQGSILEFQALLAFLIPCHLLCSSQERKFSDIPLFFPKKIKDLRNSSRFRRYDQSTERFVPESEW